MLLATPVVGSMGSPGAAAPAAAGVAATAAEMAAARAAASTASGRPPMLSRLRCCRPATQHARQHQHTNAFL